MKINDRKLHHIAWFVPLMFLFACGDGGSDSNKAPIADAGFDQTVRAMSKVLLSSRDSDDTDGALLTHDWRQISGPAVSLIRKTVNTVSFDVPALDVQTDFVFEVVVTDNDKATTADTVTVTAVPINDQNRFLTYTNTPDTYQVVAATAGASNATFARDEEFTITAVTKAIYVDNFGVSRNIIVDTTTKTGNWLAETGSTGSGAPLAVTAHNNPHLTFSVPSVNIEAIQRAAEQLSPGDGGGIDDGDGDRIKLQLDITLTSSFGGVDTYLYLLDDDGNLIAEAGDIGGSLSSNLSIDASMLTEQVMTRQVENLATSEAYYAAIDPTNTKTTLAEWLAVNNFPADCDADPNCYHAQYINHFDLAFGRDMFVYTDPVTDNVSSYVINYPSFETMVEGIKSIAVVAMEYSPGPSSADPFTKFYTFVTNPVNGKKERVLSMDFDGRGEKFMPGVCNTCHGGRPDDLVAGNNGSRFLPWDVDTLVFSDAEFDGDQNAVTLAKMPKAKFDAIHAAMKGFNQAVLKTIPPSAATPPDPDSVKELIEGWYGGAGLPNANFDGSFTPAAWKNGVAMTRSSGEPLGIIDDDTSMNNGNICFSPGMGSCVEANNPADSETLYHQVMGPYCRACHNSAGNSTPDFVSYGSFIENKDGVENFVFNQGTMPLSRRTMDQFWIPTSGNSQAAASVLAAHIGVDLPAQNPGRAIAGINGENTDKIVSADRNDTIRLDANGSQYSDSYSWSLQAPGGGGDPKSNAVLVGANTQNPAFQMDTYGDYVVTLTVTNAFSIDTVTRTITVENLFPAAVDYSASVKRFGGVDITPMDNDTLGDPTTLITSVTRSKLITSVTPRPNKGNAAIISGGTAIHYVDFGPVGDATFDYTITDIDGDESTATVTVNVTEAISAINNTYNTVDIINSTDLAIFSNDNFGTGNSTATLSISAGPAQGSLNLTSGTVGKATKITYTPNDCISNANQTDSFTYKISNGSGNSTATVTINFKATKTFTSLFDNIFSRTSGLPHCKDCHQSVGGNSAAVATGLVFDNKADAYTKVKSKINGCSNPEGSLLLRKATAQVSHFGGNDLGGTSSTAYKNILRWIKEGARNN